MSRNRKGGRKRASAGRGKNRTVRKTTKDAVFFAEVLKGLHEDVLRWIVAPTWRVDPGLERNALEEAVLEAAQSPLLEQGVLWLGEDKKQLLRMTAASDGPTPVPRLVEALGPHGHWRIQQSLQPILSPLLVVPHGQDELVVPQDLLPRLRDVLGVHVTRDPVAGEPAELSGRDPVAELADAYAFALRRGKIRLTRQGEIYKSEVNRFAKERHGKEFSDEEWREADRLLRALRMMGILMEAGSHLEPAPGTWDRLMAGSRDEVLALLLAQRLTEPNELAALAALSELEPGRWYDTPETACRLMEKSIRDPDGLIVTEESVGNMVELLEGYSLAVSRGGRAAEPICPECGKRHEEPEDLGEFLDPEELEDMDPEEREAAEMFAGILESMLEEDGEFEDEGLAIQLDEAEDGDESPRFVVSQRLADVVRILQGAKPAREEPVPCLVVNPDFEAVVMSQEPPPPLLGVLAKWGTPKPGTPVWRLDRTPVVPLNAETFKPWLRTPIPPNVARVLGSDSSTRGTRIVPAFLVEGDDVEDLLRDPAWEPHLELLAPGKARFTPGSPEQFNRLAKRLEPGSPKWTNLRILAQAMGQGVPPMSAVAERYDYGARQLAEDLGLDVHTEKQRNPWEVLRQVAALVRRDNGRPQKIKVELARPRRLSERDKKTLLACHRAIQEESTIEASFTIDEYWSRERIDDECDVLGITTGPNRIVVALSPVDRFRKYEVDVSRLNVKTSRRERPLASG